MKHEFISIGLDANFCDPTVLMQMETIGINHIQVYVHICPNITSCMCVYTYMYVQVHMCVCIYCISLNYGHSYINALSHLVAGGREYYNKIKHWVSNRHGCSIGSNNSVECGPPYI